MFVLLSSCTILAPSMSNSLNFSGYFPWSPLAASLVSDHIPWKCGIWKHEDFITNIHSLLTSNVFLVISIHIQSCGSDFWKYILLFSPSNSPKLTGLSTFAQNAHIPLNHSINIQICNVQICKYVSGLSGTFTGAQWTIIHVLRFGINWTSTAVGGGEWLQCRLIHTKIPHTMVYGVWSCMVWTDWLWGRRLSSSNLVCDGNLDSNIYQSINEM